MELEHLVTGDGIGDVRDALIDGRDACFSSASVWKMIWRRFSSLQDAQVTRTRARLPCWASTLIPQSAMFSPHAEQR